MNIWGKLLSFEKIWLQVRKCLVNDVLTWAMTVQLSAGGPALPLAHKADGDFLSFERPVFCLLELLVMGMIIILFLFDEFLPLQFVPPVVVADGVSLAFLVIYGVKVEPVDRALNVDWKTLPFLTCLFLMVEAFTGRGYCTAFPQTWSRGSAQICSRWGWRCSWGVQRDPACWRIYRGGRSRDLVGQAI
jgi:hypothetical protein